MDCKHLHHHQLQCREATWFLKNARTPDYLVVELQSPSTSIRVSSPGAKVESYGREENNRGINSSATPGSRYKGCYARVRVKVVGAWH